MQPVERAFSFDSFILDLRRGCLLGPDGEIELRPKSFQVLRYLVENAGRLVPKDEIMKAIWPNVIVGDESLARCVSDVRLALRDRGQRIVRTVPRRGYLLAVPTRAAEADAATADRAAAGFSIVSDSQIAVDRASDAISMLDPAANHDASGISPLKQPAAERRQLTVMCCGLVGSTALASRMDPEDLRAVIAAYHQCCSELIDRFGGMVAAFSGDRVLAYFGYPEAHEDDAERAVRTGLALVDAVAKLQFRLAPPLHIRIGIASGLVVLGGAALDKASREPMATGEAPDLAAQLLAIAPADAVIIAASTRHLVRGFFDYRELRRVALEGLAELVAPWQVIGTSGAESRFEALRDPSLTPLIGREEEIDLLLRRWQQIHTGEGRVVLISGEPGIGKSRLVRALQDRLADGAILSFYCSPIYQDTSLFPVITQLERIAGFRRDDTPEERLTKLEALVRRSIGEEALALLAALMSVAGGERYPLPDLSPQHRREKTLEAVLAYLTAVASKQPVLAVFEDAHWMDPTTLELLDSVVDRARGLPMLLLVTHRPEFAPPWGSHPHATTLVLNRLGNREVTAIADYVTGKRLPREFHDQIIGLSDGVPLFVEELVKTLLESGLLLELDGEYRLHGPVGPLAIPNTLQGLLTARLDRLGPAKEVAQIGGALGREFSYEVMRAVANWLPEQRLQEALQSLVRSELVYCRGRPPDAVYLFKHAVLQDAARETLLRSRRRELHARIAAVLQQRFPEIADQQPGLLAHHCTEAGLVQEAVAYWGRAGRRSADRSAMAEAAAQYQKGLDQLALLPDTSERRQREFEFHAGLGAALTIVRGYAAPETGEAFTRARELWGELGSSSEASEVHFGELHHHQLRGELALSLRLAEDLLRLSIQRKDSGGIVLGHGSCGGNLVYMGQFERSRSHLEMALPLYDPTFHRSLVDQVGLHPQVRWQAQLGLALFCLGYSDQAVALINAATAQARRLGHLPTLALTLGWSTLLWLIGEDARLNEAGNELAAMATEQGFPQWRAFGTIYHGWARVKNGDVAEGISLLRSGSNAFRATGAQVWAPHNIALLARACELRGQIEEALTLVDEALRVVDRTGERWLAAELNRQKAQFLLRQGHPKTAEELYRKAESIAVEQGAKLWELRVAVSFARLWREQRRRAEAGDLLARVYGWFTEGFGTPDLREAKALLDELAA